MVEWRDVRKVAIAIRDAMFPRSASAWITRQEHDALLRAITAERDDWRGQAKEFSAAIASAAIAEPQSVLEQSERNAIAEKFVAIGFQKGLVAAGQLKQWRELKRSSNVMGELVGVLDRLLGELDDQPRYADYDAAKLTNWQVQSVLDEAHARISSLVRSCWP